MSRRDLVKGAGASAAGAAIAGAAVAASVSPLAAAQAAEAGANAGASESFESTVAWDAEYDVVVAGYGAAGAFAAIAAAEAGAHVLILEKGQKAQAGGNSRFGQNFMAYTDRDDAIQYMKNLRGGYTAIQDDAAIEFLVDGYMTFYDWLKAHDIPEEEITYASRPEYPELWPDVDADGKYTGFRKITLRPDMRYNPQDVNAALEMLRGIVKGMAGSIDVWYGAPAERLIQDASTKVVHGVKTEVDGASYNVRAKNGVVLATGGFENDPAMLQNFTGYAGLVAKGAQLNTGDGIKMAAEAGAQLWHMTTCAAPDANIVNPNTGCTYGWTCTCGNMVPPNGWYGDMGMGGSIVVGPDGTRFMNEACNETRNSRHGQTDFHGTWTHMPWPSKAYMVFDEACRLEGHKPYNCFSDGLEDEIASGMVLKADTLEELGEAIGIDGAAIQATIDRYNGFCANGLDEDWGRQPECLFPVACEPPYYAIELVAGVTNTDGGPKRDTSCAILDQRDQPIGHLYGAGTCGSFLVGNYNGGGNMGENYVTGSQAGRSAAEPKDDTDQTDLVASPVNFADDYADPQIELGEGQYAGHGPGMGGDIWVRLTVTDGTIVDLEVVEQSETPGVGTPAIEQLPGIILAAGNTDVDTISGATRTSAGIILATEDCMRQAGIEVVYSGEETATLK